MFCYLDFRCYFEANGQNHIDFRLIQVLKNSMAWHFLTFTSPSSKLEFVYPPCCGVEEQMLIFSPIPKLTIVLIWKTSACLKFGKTSNSAVENLPQRKLLVWAANDALSHPPNFLVFLFELFVAQGILVRKYRNAVWLNAMHSGRKWWIREFVPPYIFPLNPDYVTALSLRSLRSEYQWLRTVKLSFL